MMKEQKETVGLQNLPGTNQYSGQVIPKPDLPPSLASAGIDKNLAHRIIRINQTINTATIPIAIMVVIQSIAIQPIAKRGNRVRCFRSKAACARRPHTDCHRLPLLTP